MIASPVDNPCRALAHALAAQGISSVAIAPDGTKSPTRTWGCFQRRVPSPREINAMFTPDRGIAIIAGARNTEVLDFDDPSLLDAWWALVEDECPGLLDKLPEAATPKGGRHYYYRHLGPPQGNQKLSEVLRPEPDGTLNRHTQIETRGPGGYALLPGSPPACHPLHRTYVMLRGSLLALPIISADERDTLLSCARQLDSYQEARAQQGGQNGGQQSQRQREKREHTGDDGWVVRPGDEYAAHASWKEILEPAGWRSVGQRGNKTLWCRPNKKRGASATTSHSAADTFYVFSSSAAPFEPGTSYSKFGAYALLNHSGDFTAAAKRLHQEGYGEQRVQEQQEGVRPTGIHLHTPVRPTGLQLLTPERPTGIRLPTPPRPTGIRLPEVQS